MKMYQTRSWGFTIIEVDVIRKSESSVWIMHNGRERRESNTYYFDTFELAKKSIIKRETDRLSYAEREVESAKIQIAHAMAIKEPSQELTSTPPQR